MRPSGWPRRARRGYFTARLGYLAVAECRKSGSFATLKERKGKFLDEGGKEGFGLLRHWGGIVFGLVFSRE